MPRIGPPAAQLRCETREHVGASANAGRGQGGLGPRGPPRWSPQGRVHRDGARPTAALRLAKGLGPPPVTALGDRKSVV